MTTYASDQFYGNRDYGWTNPALQGGPIYVRGCKKNIQGSGVLVDQLGFIRSDSITTATGYMFQIEFTLPRGPDCIVLCGIGLQSGLSSTNTVNILFDTFLDTPGFTGNIRLNDYGEDEVASGSAVETLQVGVKYTAKLLVNSDGTVTGYVDSPAAGLTNHNLGTTAIATDLNNAAVYFSAQQTFVNKSTYVTTWDNYFVHDEGLSFSVPTRQDANLCSHEYALKEKYR